MNPIRLASLLLLSACAGGSTPTMDMGGCEGEFSDFQPGITASTDRGSFEVSLVEATPDPPDVGLNDWVLYVENGSGPVLGASVIVEPWMPAHGHGVSPPTYIGQAGEAPGEYIVPAFDLVMPGVWEFKVNVNQNMVSDNATFTFCAEG